MEDFDLIIVGAGISGINTAYRIKSELPSCRYAILDARDDIGGTWSFFRYPGLRSDSDLYTFGFSWKPWLGGNPIATGSSIMQYLREAVRETEINQRIRLQHRVTNAEWSSEQQSWRLSVINAEGISLLFRAKFLVLGTGYYDYDQGLPASIPGLENFTGPIIHPQFWPEDFDHSKKKITIIGSGATAITLLPSLAECAAHVTMLQRSPTYIMSISNSGSLSEKGLIPASFSVQLNRLFFLIWPILFYYFCRCFPSLARAFLQRAMAKELPEKVSVYPHFTPRYQPWDQRVCFSPDGDFFRAIRNGKANVETGTIQKIVEDGIILQSGKKLHTDLIITATGLKLKAMGGVQLKVDGQKISIGDKYAWNNAMIQDAPNLFFMLGYINASWTLGADTSALLLCRLLKHMQLQGYSSAVAAVTDSKSISFRPLLGIKSTYVTHGVSELPKCGNRGPWIPRKNYFFDLYKAKFGDFTSDLLFNHQR